MTRTAGLLCFFLLWLLPRYAGARAQDTGTRKEIRECYLYTQLDDDDGLPQNSVMATYIDPRTGLLWIATQGGIARYDGHTMQGYNARDDRFSKRFVSIFGTATGQVFCLALDGSLYTIKNNRLLYVPDNRLKLNPYPYIYFRGGVCDTAQLAHLGIFGDTAWRDLWPTANHMIPVDRNTLLACGKDRILLYRNGKVEKTIPFPAVSRYRIVKQQEVFYFIDNGLTGFRFDMAAGRLIPLERGAGLPHMPEEGNLEPVYHAPYYDYLSGQVNCWLKDTFYQLAVVNDRLEVAQAYHLPGMPDDAVTGILHPERDVLVVGSSSKGIYLYKIQPFRQILKDAGKYTSIYAQMLLDKERLITSQSWIYNLASDKLEGHTYSTQARQIRSFSKDRKGYVYYSWANKLFRLDPVTRKAAPAFPCEGCRDISFTYYDTLDDRFWMMSAEKTGYWENGQFRSVPWATREPPPVISAIRHLPGQPLLVSTTDGIWYYDPDKQQWLAYPETQGRIYRYFTPEKNGMRILSGFGEGSVLWNRGTGKLEPLPTDRGGYLKFVHTFIPDHRGYLWATTNKGLFRFRESDVLAYKKGGEEPYYEYYDRREGLQTNEFNGAQYPIFNWWNSNLLLSTINGITIFKPDNMPEYRFDEPLYIESVFRSDGAQVVMSGPVDNKFSFAERDLKFQVSTAAWYNVYGLSIAYKLDGDEPWKPVDPSKMEIVLSGLRAGPHTLQVRKRKGFRDNDYVYSSFEFAIERKYYEHPFFIFFLAMCGLGMLMLFSRLRQLRLIKVNKKLSAMVAQKTKALQQSNLQLQQSLSQIEQSQNFRLRLISMLLHDIATPLSSIEKISDMLSGHYVQLDTGTRIEGVGRINRTVRELQALSRQLIDWAQVSLYTGGPVLKPFTLQSLAEEVSTVMAEHVFAAKQNAYTASYDPDDMLVSDPTVLKHIILNVLFNANKYTEKGKVHMKIYREHINLLYIVVQDTGTGMQPETAAQLNAYTVITPSEIKSGTAKEVGWGLGYQIIFDLLAMLKGSLKIRSIPGEGTEIRIMIPVKLPPRDTRK